jgi:ribonucleoside-diphosphate reductase alpha chain
MKKSMMVKKRSGETEKFDADKINKVLAWACESIPETSFEEVAMNANLSFFDGISSRDIHNTLIEAACGLITEEKPQYQYVASRLLNYQLRKEVWGGKNAPKLLEFVKINIASGVYDKDILDWYDEREFNKLDEYLRHDRDFDFTYAGIKQLCEKYLVQNRTTKKIYETPQFAYILIAMTLFRSYKSERLTYIKKAYNYFSQHKINLPTPIMAGVRTPLRSYASCALFTVDDTLDSIFSNNTAVGLATANRYGIGMNVSRIRAVNAPVKNGMVSHTGPVPFLKMFESTVKSCHQNGIRGGSATVNVAWFHHDIEDILVLKNNAGTDDNRVRKLDYCIGFDRVFYERAMSNKTITLFSYHEAPELWNNFGMPDFKDLYEAAEKNTKLKFRKVVNARDILMLFSKERVETGRIYVMNVDHANSHGSWQEQVDTSNLCLEVNHPLKAISDVKDKDGEIGVCILSAVNLLTVSASEMESVCDVIVRMLEELIDHQLYFVPAAENFAKNRRSLGVGVTNLAAYLAQLGVKYTDKNAPNKASVIMEQVSYNLIKASVNIAIEKGACAKFSKTKFSQGILPIDTYCKAIDEFVTEKLHCDWDELRKLIAKHGMRHSTLTAIMPVESSSVIQSSTNGIEPPRSLISFKRSKSGVIPVVVPNIKYNKNNYTLAFEMPSNDGYLKVVAALQKFVDMSISTNLYYNTTRYPNKIPPQTELIKDILLAYKYGIKNLYYTNTFDGDTQTVLHNKATTQQVVQEKVEDQSSDDSNGCAGGACTL